MSESMFFQIKKDFGEEEGQKIINEIKRNPQKENIENALIIYTSLTFQQAEEILKKYGYSLDAALEELEKENFRAEEEKRRQRMIEEKNKKEQESQQFLEMFAKHFKSLTKEEITKVFHECGRDPKRTSQALVELMKQKKENEESQKVKKEMQINNMTRIYLSIYAELHEEYVVRIIREHDLDDEKIDKALDEENKQRMFQTLFSRFSENLSAEEIQQFLRESDWQKMEAAKKCLLKSQEREREKKVEELNEVMRQQQEEEKKQQEAPKLEFNEKDRQEFKEKSAIFTLPNVHKLMKQEEQRQEEQTLKIIENELVQNLEPEPEQDKKEEPEEISQELSHSITVAEVDGKLHAKARVIGGNSYSWIGFYKKGETDGRYTTYNYICNLKENTLIVDKPTLNGEYEFRAFLSKYQIACKSETVVVTYADKVMLKEVDEKTVTVTWRVGSFDPYQSRAYVTIHKVEEQRYNYYRRWNWMEVVEGSHSFKKPIHSGVYEARVYIGSELKFKSGTIEVQGI